VSFHLLGFSVLSHLLLDIPTLYWVCPCPDPCPSWFAGGGGSWQKSDRRSFLVSQELGRSNVLETHANDEVCSPVGASSHCHSCRPGPLRKELSHEKPGNGSWSHLKESHKAEDGQHADVAHPWHTFLVNSQPLQREKKIRWVSKTRNRQQLRVIQKITNLNT
ncbi:hypothetical protein AOLI_G00110590, partial [Acnodon oligacanthus]